MELLSSILKMTRKDIVKGSTLLANFLIWPVVILSLFLGRFYEALFIALFVLLVNGLYIFYQKKNNFKFWSSSVLIMIVVITYYFFFEGGIDGAGHLWVFVFPLMAYEFVNYKRARWLILAYFCGLLFLYIVSFQWGLTPRHHTPAFIIAYFLVIVTVNLFLYFHVLRKHFYSMELLQNKERYEALFNNLSIGVIMLDKNLHVQEANDVMKEWFPDVRSPGKRFCYDLFHPENKGAPCAGCPVIDCFTEGKTVSLEQRKQSAEGERIYRLVANPMFDQNNKVYAVIETLEDITSQVQVQEDIYNQKETFSSLVNSLSDVIYTLDKEQKHTGVYGDWVEKQGLNADFFLGKSSRELFGSEASAVHEEANQKALQGESVVYEWEVGEGENAKYFQTSVSPLRNAQQEITGLVGVGRDITSLKQAQLSIKHNEEIFRALASNSTAGIFLFSEGRFVSVNRAVTEISGYTEQELLQMTNLEVVHPEHRDLVSQRARARFEGDTSIPNQYEIKILTRSGQTRWVDLSITLIELEGKPATIGTLFDITGKKEAEERIVSQNKFFQTVADISTSFITAKQDNIDRKVDDMLQKCGEFLRVDRTFLFQFTEDLEYMSNTHEWCANGIKPVKDEVQDYPVNELPWIAQLVESRQVLYVPDVDALPDEFEADKKELQRQQIKSVLVVPIIKSDHVIGYFGFDAVREKRELDEEQVQLMSVLANILGDALVKVSSENQLREFNDRFNQLAMQSRTVTWEISPDGLYTYISPVVKSLLGYEPEEIIGKKYYYDLFPVKIRDEYIASIEEKHTQNEPFTGFVNELRAKNGDHVWVTTNSMPVLDEKGDLIAYRGMDRDITLQKQMEEAVIYTSALQKMAVEVSSEFISADHTNVLQKINDALKTVAEFLQLDRAYVFRFKPGAETYNLLYEWCAPGVKPSFENSQELLNVEDFPWWFRQIKNSSSVVVEDVYKLPDEAQKEKELFLQMDIKSLVGYPFLYQDELEGFLGFDAVKQKINFTAEQLNVMQLIARIISDAFTRSMTERALLESEKANREVAARYQAYIDASNTGAWEYDHKNGMVWCSPQYFGMLGRDTKDYGHGDWLHARKLWAELLHPGDVLQALSFLSQYMNNPEGTYEQVYRMKHKDGSYRWIMSRGKILPDEKGSPTDILVGTHIDISQQKKSEDIIRNKNKELESYLYAASHDLRAPMVNIQGFTNRIQKQIGKLDQYFENKKPSQEHSDEIHQIMHEGMPRSMSFIFASVKKMDTLINGLLLISRTGRVKITPVKVDMDKLMKAVVKNFGYLINELNATVVLQKNMPDCFGDALLINQLFSNLLDNAIKYRKAGEPLKIEITGTRQNDFVTYSIKDNGIGIEEKNMKKIWDVFYRVNADDDIGGSGIGLNLSLKIIEKHQGSLWAQSKPGQGSEFFVRLSAVNFIADNL